LKVNSASCWFFLLYEYITMYGQQNIKLLGFIALLADKTCSVWICFETLCLCKTEKTILIFLQQ